MTICNPPPSVRLIVLHLPRRAKRLPTKLKTNGAGYLSALSYRRSNQSTLMVMLWDIKF
jgi:hypothetical protein